MDPIVHGVISGLIATKKKERNWKQLLPFIVYGVLPDFYTIFIFGLAAVGIKSGVFDDMFFSFYNVTHSLIIWLAVWLIISLGWRRIYWPVSMWGLHIVLDIVSHQTILTPILWPLSDFKINGWFNYQTPKALIITYAIMAPLMIFFWFNKKIKKDRG